MPLKDKTQGLVKFIFILSILTVFTACTAPKEISYNRYDMTDLSIPQDKTLYIKADLLNDVRFQGYYDYDDLDLGAEAMTYQASNGVELLAQILIHAATVESMKNEVKTGVQNHANMVLSPYQRYIQEFEGEELLSSVIEGLDNKYDFKLVKLADGVSEQGWILWSEPTFYMTQDQQELILRHGMYLTSITQPDVVLHRNMIEVASKPVSGEDPLKYWINENNLPIVSGELYAHSVELFIADALDQYNTLEAKEKTFRFKQGGETHYERGTLVKQECGKTTIKTLRGGFRTYPSQEASLDPLNDIDMECTALRFVDLTQTVKLAH
jgi:hypothetical protein